MKRECGGCQICCTLLPVRELSKGADERCAHQRFGKGCSVYGTAKMPLACKLWTCRWLADADTEDLRRPDRAGYVVDIVPDYVTAGDGNGQEEKIEVIQIWVDPRRPRAYRDPALYAYLERQAKKRRLGLVRFANKEAVLLVPPSLSGWPEWREIESNMAPEPEHSAEQVVRVLAQIPGEAHGQI